MRPAIPGVLAVCLCGGVAAAEPVPSTKSGPTADPGRSCKILAAGLGVVGAGLVIATPLWAYRVQQRYNRDGGSRDSASLDLKLASTAWFVGVGMVGTGIYLYLTAPRRPERTRVVMPVVGQRHVGLAVTGAF